MTNDKSIKHIYCISGLGADERVFSKMKFEGHQVHFIRWVIPEKNETIESYAKKMILQIHHENPIMIGLSFGGIMCIEISKLIKTELIILISSVKSSDEIPFWMKLSGKLKLNKIIPLRSLKFIEPFEDYNLGVKTKQEKIMVQEYRKNIDPKYSDWAIDKVINWKSKSSVPNIFHIHGDNDKIFSIKNIKADYVIRDGGHFMIMNRSKEVNKYINTILQEFEKKSPQRTE